MKMTNDKIIRQIVNLPNGSYPLYYGINNLNFLPFLLKHHKIQKKILVLTDKKVKRLFGRDFEKQILSEYDITWSVISEGEQFKTLKTVNALYDKCTTAGIDKSSCIISFGGGVIQDIGNYLSATFNRGTPFVQIPTTLLSQADTGLGGCAINHPDGKSLVGTFYRPKFVYMDIGFLKQLSDKHISNGISEIINKVVCLSGLNFENIENEIPLMKSREPRVLQKYVVLSNKIKKRIIERDETGSKGSRMILDFGHTITHALERIVNYNILHGEALGIGMYGAMLMSNKIGHISKKDVLKFKQLITLAELPVELPKNVDLKKLIRLMHYDQKVINGNIRFILLRSLGKPFLSSPIKEAVILDVLKSLRNPQY